MGFSGWIDGKLADHNGASDPTKPKKAGVDTVALKGRIDADVKQGKQQADDGRFWNQLETSTPDPTERKALRQKTDEAQAGLNRTAAEWKARNDTLDTARGKKPKQ